MMRSACFENGAEVVAIELLSRQLNRLLSGEYQAAITLCDKLLPVTINGNYAKQGLRDLRTSAEDTARGKQASAT
jgi:hypothetical protein